MNLYKKVAALIILCVFSSYYKVNAQNSLLEKAESFFPSSEVLNDGAIDWKYLSVPENWGNPSGNQIKIAVSIIKNSSGKENADAVVFVQGGPGAGGIQNIWTWLNHPLSKENDIILFDARGTGFSEPRLCPDLGKKFLNIFAKDQSADEDTNQKTFAALSCKRELLDRGVDINAYNSLSISQDLNALKTKLGYSNWHVYGVSYGTYIAQVYANHYSQDVKTLILDSPISDISSYYTKNTSNYMNSLSKVFRICEKDEDCNLQYPNLKSVYFQTIASLEKEPITVKVDKSLIKSGKFTYNAEDFKVAIQQALYYKKLVEVIPLLIYQFHNRNEDALGVLVQSFSQLLNMDYGMYYCVSCNETLPNNSLSDYQKDELKYKELKGGISFYKSDFKVCDQWNSNEVDSLLVKENISSLSDKLFPVIVFSGEFDPITPASNGNELTKKIKNAHLLNAPTYGHTPGFTRIGSKISEGFIKNPKNMASLGTFDMAPKLDIVKDVKLNSGVSNMGNSLNELNPIFLSPLIIAFLIMVVFAIIYVIKLVRKKYTFLADKMVRAGVTLTSITGITVLLGLVIALRKVSNTNFFILAFGLPETYNYLFIGVLVFLGLLILTLVYFIIRLKKINERSVIFSVLFSNILLAVYLMYWEVI